MGKASNSRQSRGEADAPRRRCHPPPERLLSAAESVRAVDAETSSVDNSTIIAADATTITSTDICSVRCGEE